MDRSKQIVRVSLIGILANMLLVAGKAFAGFVTGSIAIILDALNNLSDALSSVITIVGTKLAGRAPDRKHPFGHGRIEHITSLIIAVIVLLAGASAFRESVEKILHPSEVNYTAVSLIIVAVAVIVKFILGRWVKKRGETLHSESLIASGTDAFFDSIISLTTLIAAGISLIWHINLEGYLGAVISVVIVKAGIEILMESLNGIIGTRVDGEVSLAIKEKVTSFPEVHGAYDLILHHYGPEKIIGSVHIEVDDDMTAREIHHLTRKIMETIYAEFGIIITVGVYASNSGDEETLAIKAEVEEILKAYPQVLQLHGFYSEPGTDRVTFDLVIAFGSDAAGIIEEIKSKLAERYPDKSFDIILDSDFTD
ncbi:MAG: cation transporter [Clostridia bacterium]|nr:cation transporter [Clostridia bacterium]